MALITATQVINLAFTNKNTDTYLIKPAFIEIAELNHIKPNIGEKLYETISNEVNAGTVWSNTANTDYIITCVDDVAGSLHHEYITLYSANDAAKYAVYIDIFGGAPMATPPGYDGVIAADATAWGAGSTAASIALVMHNNINAHPDFPGACSVNGDELTISSGINAITEPNMETTGFTIVGGGYNITSGSTTVTCFADSFIQVGDFVTGTGIPVNADSDSGGLCKVETVDTPGAVTSFTISGTATATNSAASLTFRRPNGKLKEDFIVNYLAFCVKFEVMPDMTYNTTSQGVVENVADFTLPVSSKKLLFLRQETFKKAETYLRLMHDFICENQASYPDFCNPNAGGVSKKHGIIIY